MNFKKLKFGISCLLGILCAWLFALGGASGYAAFALFAIALAMVIFSKRFGRMVSLFGSGACTLLIFGALLFALASPPQAEAQVTATDKITLTNIPASIIGGTTSNSITSQVWDYDPEKGFSAFAEISGTNAATTGATTFMFVPSYPTDASGTNFTYATTNGMTLTINANGTNVVRGFANFSPPTWRNIRKVKLYSIYNANDATNRTYPTNIVIQTEN